MLTDYASACLIFGARGGVMGAEWLASVDNVHLDTVYQAIPYIYVEHLADVVSLAAYKARKASR